MWIRPKSMQKKTTPWNSFGLIKCPFEWICSHLGIWFQFSIEIHQPTFSSLLFKVSQHTVGRRQWAHAKNPEKKTDEKWNNSHSKYLNMHIQMRNENRLNFQYFHLFSEFYSGFIWTSIECIFYNLNQPGKVLQTFPLSTNTLLGVVHAAAHG